MANFAQFMTFHKKTDEPFILPDPDSGEVVRCFSGWSPANLDTTRDVVLMFMVRLKGRRNSGCGSTIKLG